MSARFAGATDSSVLVLGDDCDPAQFEPFRVPPDCTVKLTAIIEGKQTYMTLCGRNGDEIEEMRAKAHLPGFSIYRMNGDLASTEREFVAESYMRAHGVVDDQAGTKKRAFCSWLYAVEFATSATSPTIAETGSVTLTVLPGYSIHLTRPKSGGGARVEIKSAALEGPLVKHIDAPTLHELTLALGEAMYRPAAMNPLDLLKEYDVDNLSYERGDKPEGLEWINKDGVPIAHIDLLTRGGKPIKQRSFFANECDPCLVCGLPIYHWYKRTCEVRNTSTIRLIPKARVCYPCSTQFYKYLCRTCGADATLAPYAHVCASGTNGSVVRIPCPAPLRRHRMWGSLELVHDKANHSLVPTCAPALPHYVYCGDDRATPWQRLEYISRWAHSILGRRTHRASAFLVGHIDSFPTHIIDRILAHIRDSIHPPSHRWIPS
jgi:hypothetical protein